jgi:thioesterase domain-containing protein
MGIQADFFDGRKLVLTAPLSANVNHQLSAFGGSLFSVSALAGWSILQLKLAEIGISANTVIAGGDVGYASPVFEDIRCELELPPEYDAFAQRLESTGRGSLLLNSSIYLSNADEPAMSFNGKYVVRQI